MRVCFWVYVAVAFSLAVLQYLSLFNAHPSRLTVQSMTPAWILPIFPVMISGTLAQIVAPEQPPAARLAIIVAGISFQGLGWMVAFIMYAAYLHRLMEFGLPAPNLRPGMFISVGPPGFTCVALMGLSGALPEDHGYFASHPAAIETLQTVALFASMFLWMLAFWFFCVSACAVLLGVREMSFHLIWWSLIFPNVGFTNATIKIGQQLESQAVLWVASAMTILLVMMWMVVLVAQVRAVARREILMEGKDEDKGESVSRLGDRVQVAAILTNECAQCYREDDDKFTVASPQNGRGV